MRGDRARICECSDPVVRRYQGRLSGPLLERMDLHVAVPVAPWKEFQQGPGESTADVRDRVLAARDRQQIEHVVDRLHLSVRSYARTLRVSRTIADLAGQDRIDTNALAEALVFRRSERE